MVDILRWKIGPKSKRYTDPFQLFKDLFHISDADWEGPLFQGHRTVNPGHVRKIEIRITETDDPARRQIIITRYRAGFEYLKDLLTDPARYGPIFQQAWARVGIPAIEQHLRDRGRWEMPS